MTKIKTIENRDTYYDIKDEVYVNCIFYGTVNSIGYPNENTISYETEDYIIFVISEYDNNNNVVSEITEIWSK